MKNITLEASLANLCGNDYIVNDFGGEIILELNSIPKIYVSNKNIDLIGLTAPYIVEIYNEYDRNINSALVFINYNIEYKFSLSNIGVPDLIFRDHNNKDSLWEMFFNKIELLDYRDYGIVVYFKKFHPVKLDNLQIEDMEKWYNEETGKWIDL